MFPVTAEPEVKVAAIRRILFLGNSITLHGPKADIGWTGNWGMAASSEDKDYVHLVTSALARHIGSTPQILVKNIADFERNYADYDVDLQMKELFAFDADLVVLAIGENVPALASDDAQGAVQSRSDEHPALCPGETPSAGGGAKLFLGGSRQGPDAPPGLPGSERHVCQRRAAGTRCGQRGRSERSFAHAGVAGHPGDKGMKALADAIVQAVVMHSGRSD